MKGPFSALHTYAKKYPFLTFVGLFAFFLIVMLAVNRSAFSDDMYQGEWISEFLMPAWVFALGFLFGIRFLFK